MCQVQPTLRRLDGVRPLPVLAFLDGMVAATAERLLAFNEGVFHAVDQSPSDAGSAAGIDEAVLRARIERILAVHELGVQHHVALLALRHDIGQALPGDQVVRAGHAGGGHGGRQVVGPGGILALHAENAVDPAVFMRSQPHVVDIGGRFAILRHRHGTGPETEIVDTAGTLRHSEEGFAVRPFNPCDQDIFSIPLDGAGIEHGMDAEALQQVGIRIRMQVVAPLQRGMLRRQHRIRISFINTVPFDGNILPFNQLLVRLPQPGKSLFVGHSRMMDSLSQNCLKSSSFSKPFQGA